MKKLITTALISSSLFTTASFAQTCEDRGNEIVNIYNELYAGAAEMTKVNELSKEFCDDVAILWQTGKDMLIKNGEHIRDCDTEGVFGESEPLIHFMIGAIGASNNGCHESGF